MSETERTGSQIVGEAWQTFGGWVAAQPDEVQDLDILTQIELYHLSANHPERTTE